MSNESKPDETAQLLELVDDLGRQAARAMAFAAKVGAENERARVVGLVREYEYRGLLVGDLMRDIEEGVEPE